MCAQVACDFMTFASGWFVIDCFKINASLSLNEKDMRVLLIKHETCPIHQCSFHRQAQSILLLNIIQTIFRCPSTQKDNKETKSQHSQTTLVR